MMLLKYTLARASKMIVSEKNNFLTRTTATKIMALAQLIASRTDVNVCLYVLVGHLTNTCSFVKKVSLKVARFTIMELSVIL